MKNYKLRVARHTDNLDQVVKQYTKGFGFKILSQFKDHEGFDGVIIGEENSPYHFEFTHHKETTVGKAPTQDNLIVFYISSREEWETQCSKMINAGFEQVKSYNPYWDIKGKTFEDVDGYRVVLENSEWLK